MKITFPHMGNIYIAAKVVFDRLDVDYVMPEPRNRAALEKALTVAPESICLPFKTILGNFIEGLDKGADAIVFGGGHGRCRLSYFGDLIKETLEEMGYTFDFLFMDFNQLDLHQLAETFGPLVRGKSVSCITRALVEGGHTIFSVDRLYALSRRTRCRELHQGDTDAVMRRFEKAVLHARDAGRILAELREAHRALHAVLIDPEAKPLRVMLVGEIFTACEPFVNLEIERKLGQMGVDVYNTLGLSCWVRDHFLGNVFPFLSYNKPKLAARAYARTDDFGGLGIETIGNAALARENGMEGVVQIYPLTCMPEIVAEAAMPHVQKRAGIPVMTLVVDEQTGEAGFITRLEAFTDMLATRRTQPVLHVG
ncbi:MAG: hypothetical protein ABF904_08140 [Ethanoligenens sp.]